MTWFRNNGPGIGFTLIPALAAAWMGSVFPIVGGAVFGIVLGIFINNIFGKPAWANDGIGFTAKKVLQWAIVILGTGLNLAQVSRTGLESLYVMLFTLSFAFLAAYGLGRLLKVPERLTSLIGVGTAICGGSAIAAIAPIIEAEEMETAYSISTIFLFNVIAVLIFPPLGHWLGFSEKAFGLWAGTAVNDTSSVVAAGYAFSNSAGAYATIVKLTRTTMIIPIAVIFALAVSFRKKRSAEGSPAVNFSLKKIFPWFIVGFLAASLLNTLGLFRADSVDWLGNAGKFLIVMALTAVGLNADFKKMLKTGIKPLLLGLLVWLVVAVVSIAVQSVTGQV